MLRVDYEGLASSSSTLLQQSEAFGDCIDIMTSVIRDLPDAWEAETCDRFVEQYFDAEPKLKDVKQMIEDMAMQMRQISENFEKADQDMKSQM